MAIPVRHPWRWVAVAVIAVLAAMAVNSVITNDNWDWSYQFSNIFSSYILGGVWTTLWLTVAAMVIGVVLGIVLAVMRQSQNPILRGVAWGYIWLFRGVPVLVQLFLWFNVASLYRTVSLGIPFGPHFVDFNTTTLITSQVAAILGLGLNEAAYMAEIVRAGILSVDAGQSEAASALGMRRGQIMRRIVLPQAMRVIIPPTGNETISMLKTTSLASVVIVYELTFRAQNLSNVTYKVFPMLVMASLWYLAISSILMIGQSQLEKRYAPDRDEADRAWKTKVKLDTVGEPGGGATA